MKLMWAGFVLAGLATAAYAQAPVARWNLGEQDAGAAAGNPGDVLTKDAIGTNDLAANGAPIYSANVPGPGSTVSMSFEGASFYQASLVGTGEGLDVLYGSLDVNNLSLSCDVYMTTLGIPGFSFPVSIGANAGGGGGLAIVEIGGFWHLINQGQVASGAGPAVVLNTWTHLDLVRKNFESAAQTRLFINGADAGISINPAPGRLLPFFTIAGNEKGSNVPLDVEGLFQGLVDNVVITNLNLNTPPKLTGIAVSPGTIYSSNSIILTAAGVTGDPGGRTFVWRKSGIAVTNSGAAASVTLPNVKVTNSGNYDVVLTNNFGAVTSAVVTVTVLDASYSGGGDVVKFRMGDNDPGAADGNPGNVLTKDALGTNDLTAFGAPLYSTNVPSGGGAFSMSFDGASYYQSTSLVDLYRDLDFNNFSLSLDVYVTALGGGGFSFPISMGGQSGGGFSIVEIGGTWYLLHQTVAQSSVGFPVTLNQWTHLELQRRQFGIAVRSRLFVNGVDVGAEITGGPALPIHPILTVGANARADEVSVEGPFTGLIDNVVIHNYSIGAKPVLNAGPSAEPGNILLIGESLTLAATAQGGSPLTYNWRKNGTIFASTVGASGAVVSTALTNVTAADSGNYDLVVTNLLGSVTSAVVKVTVLPPGTPRPTPTVKYRLGEDDPGAVSGGAGNATTKPASGSLELAATGTPFYSADVPAGGSTLSMSFDGASYYRGTGDPWTAFCSTFDFNHCSISCDVYVTAVGAPGFSFPVSIGANAGGGGGLAIVEIGGFWHLINQGQVASEAGPAVVLNTWTHLELRRMNFGSGLETRLFIDGADAGISIKPAPGSVLPYFAIAGNTRSDFAIEGLFNGQIDNVLMFSYTSPASTLSVQAKSGQVLVVSQGMPGASYTLLRTPRLNSTTWTVVTNGIADTTGRVTLTDSAPPTAGSFYRTSAP